MAFKQKSYILKFAILKVTPTACGKYIIVTEKKIGNGTSSKFILQYFRKDVGFVDEVDGT